MKLNIKGCRKYCKENNITGYKQLAKTFGLSVTAIRLLEQGNKIGHEAVKHIYNKIGAAAVLQIIDFEEETPNDFKNKYVAVGARLY